MSRVDWNISDTLAALRNAATFGIGSSSALAANLIGRSMGRGSGPSAPGTPPNVQSGLLRRRIMPIEAKNLVSGVRASVPYAMIHERGGTINARGKLLTIPLNPEARKLRRQFRDLSSANLRLIVSRRGNKLLVKDNGKGSGFTPMFVLKSRVVMPKRPFLWPGIRNNAAAIVRRFARDTQAAFRSEVSRRFAAKFAGGAR